MEKERILNKIKELQAISNNMCGTSSIKLNQYIKIDLDSLKTHLNELFVEKKIIARKGINSTLIFLPNKK